MARLTAEEKARTTRAPVGVRHFHFMRRGPSYSTSYFWKLSRFQRDVCGTDRCRLLVILEEDAGRALFNHEVQGEEERVRGLLSSGS